MNYTNYTNLDARFSRTYEPGDRLVRGWQGELPDVIDVVDAPSARAAAEVVYMLHNRDDRPDGQLCPSMSVGDVVVFGEMALSVDIAGWQLVDLDANDIVPGTYLEAVR